MHIPLITEVTILFGIGIVILFFCHRLKVPAIVGFLLTGILVGPHGLAMIDRVEEVDFLAEIGVVLLLFTIGLEFSLKRLWELRRSVLLGGAFQVLGTIAVTVPVAIYFDMPTGRAVFIGFVVALSSTAIVLKLLEEKAEVGSPHGGIAVSILIFQDVVAVPMMLVTPFLAGNAGEGSSTSDLLLMLLKGIAIVALSIVSARWVVPHLLYQIARTRSRELFLLTVVVLCLAVGWLTSSAGLSAALGAFLAGLIISESDYSNQALSNLMPLRDLFTSVFFISIGMLVNVRDILAHPVLVFAGAVAIMGGKAVVGGAAAAVLGYPLRTMVLSGLCLCQVGEFSFILSKTGASYGLLTEQSYPIFLAVSVVTMAATPFVMAAGPGLARLMLKLPLPEKVRAGLQPTDDKADAHSQRDHLIVVGFGLNGRNVARTAKSAGIPYVVLEMNPETVRREKARGEPIVYGDASQPAVLEHAGIHRARVMVVAIPDPLATRMAVASARDLNPALHIITRTRFLAELQPLRDLGANEVIPEEFETSVEIFSRVLATYFVPQDEIERMVSEIRNDGYEMLRSLSEKSTSVCASAACDLSVIFPDTTLRTFRVKEGARVAGRSLRDMGLREKHGVTVIAIRRGMEMSSNPRAATVLDADDLVVLVGNAEDLVRARALFDPAMGV